MVVARRFGLLLLAQMVKTIVSGGEDYTIKIWDLATGTLKDILRGHTQVVTSVAIGADGQNIISGSDDQTIKVWGQ